MRRDPSYDPRLADGPVVEQHLPRIAVERRELDSELRYWRDAERRGRRAADADDGNARAQSRIDDVFWYHTIELPDGTVTPGLYDHRPIVAEYGIPSDVAGLRVLDVGTHDGFWAFEFERRGAEVDAIDIGSISESDLAEPVREAMVEEGIDRPLGQAFGLAKEALGSRVRRIERSVYELDPAELGTYDLVHSGDMLLHLERPLAALRRIRRMTHDRALIGDAVDRELEGSLAARYLGGGWGALWWLPSPDALAQMIVDAGFRDVSLENLYRLPARGTSHGLWHATFLALT